MTLHGRAKTGRGIAIGLGVSLALTASLHAQDSASYYEFGTVVALGQRSVEVQTSDPQRPRPVVHTFLLTRDTRADLVHIGDSVEVIYSPSGADLVLRRVVLLLAGIPKAGPPAVETAAALPSAPPPSTVRPTTPPRTSRSNGKNKPVVPPVTHAAVALPPAPPPAAAPSRAGNALNLGNPNALHAAPLTNVPLGVPASATVKLNAPGSRAIAHDAPGAECNRGSADWPAQPLSIAVLDFRYPTEREESHDIGTTGGGAGTAVADLVFNRLGQLQEFQMQRGDRRRLDRTDIAGAARLGRQLGVDAVLAGTFQPVPLPPGAEDDPYRPPTYELRAGLVDTCTGQVLMKLSSDVCAENGGKGNGCVPPSITAKQASNPEANAGAFAVPMNALLAPLEHNTTPQAQPPMAGVVLGATDVAVTLRVTSPAQVRVGEELAVHATRLAKNPTTYTLNILRDQEIGRIVIKSVQGATATGSYTGDIPAKAGDQVESLSAR
ncbi:hypothetical protein [Granulicella tundricola]|uniref:hypothetical protein n=1 Tax=Granulicella tundricola TaxID=940615 RepID=UPI0012FA0DF0|nr:hypothetical protein [Granulicella tundricola]